MKLASLFDGIGGFPLAAMMLGIEPVWASEIEKFPMEVTKIRFPNMKHYGDVTKIKGSEVEPVDIITFGSPCFPKGVLVITEEGYVPIERVKVGDKVLTHTGKWQKVLRIGSKIADTIVLKGFGHPGLECTKEHPFYASKKKANFKREEGKAYRTFMTPPEWIEAQEMKGKFWGTVINTESLSIPLTEKSNRRNDAPEMTYDFWWMVGRWLGDGWLRDGQRSKRPQGQNWGQIFICCSHEETALLESQLSKLKLDWAKFPERTVTKFRVQNKNLAEWLSRHFGKLADGKKIPAWILSLDKNFRQAILDGYFSADGWRRPNGSYSASTVSKSLALGVRWIAESLGYSSPLYFNKMNPTKMIEGRLINQKDFYNVRYDVMKPQTSRREAYGISWGKVRKIEEGNKDQRVYNLEVENDNSYIVENIIVHNCQDLSLAGKRAGLDGQRSGLFMEAIRIIKEMREATNGRYPRYGIWENVPGAFSSNGGEDFRVVLESFAQVTDSTVSIPRPPKGKWETAGLVEGDNYSIGYRLLNSQYWGVPQRRRRIFIISDFGGNSASEIFFESEGLSWYSKTSGNKRKSFAGNPTASLDSSIFGTQGNGCSCGRCRVGDVFNESGPGFISEGVGCLRAEGENRPTRPTHTVVCPTLTRYNLDSRSPQSAEQTAIVGAVLQANTEDIGIPILNGQGSKGNSVAEISNTMYSLNAMHGYDMHCIVKPNKSDNPICFSGSGFSEFKEGQVASTLRSSGAKQTDVDLIVDNNQTILFEPRSQDGTPRIHNDICPTLNTAQGGQRQPCVCVADNDKHSMTIASRQIAMSVGNEIAGPVLSTDYKDPQVVFEWHNQDSRIKGPIDTAATLNTNADGKEGHLVQVMTNAEGSNGATLTSSNVGKQLNNQTPLVATQEAVGFDGYNSMTTGEVSSSLGTNCGLSTGRNGVITNTVRRLTPLECERLQGYPDYFTLIPGASDSARYKALGNSVAIPCVFFILSCLIRNKDKEY